MTEVFYDQINLIIKLLYHNNIKRKDKNYEKSIQISSNDTYTCSVLW